MARTAGTVGAAGQTPKPSSLPTSADADVDVVDEMLAKEMGDIDAAVIESQLQTAASAPSQTPSSSVRRSSWREKAAKLLGLGRRHGGRIEPDSSSAGNTSPPPSRSGHVTEEQPPSMVSNGMERSDSQATASTASSGATSRLQQTHSLQRTGSRQQQLRRFASLQKSQSKSSSLVGRICGSLNRRGGAAAADAALLAVPSTTANHNPDCDLFEVSMPQSVAGA